MNADPAVCYTHSDFAYFPGLILQYVGKPMPESDRESIHACPEVRRIGAESIPKPKGLFRRHAPEGTYAPEREELARAMGEAGWSYLRMAAAVGLSDKTVWRHLTGRGTAWQHTFRRVAEIVGRPDLAEWAMRQP